jgi:glycosyltransferase involved in cell wall biosynthesis
MKGLDVQCKIYGDGPAKDDLERRAKHEGIENVSFLGYKPHEELKTHVQKGMFAVLPSEWYENNPLMVIEAFALGKPVIGSRIGGIQELVEYSKTGLTFEPGNSVELKGKILWLLNPPTTNRNGKSQTVCRIAAILNVIIEINKYHQAMVNTDKQNGSLNHNHLSMLNIRCVTSGNIPERVGLNQTSGKTSS